MDRETKIKLAMGYGIFLFLIFLFAPYFGLVTYHVVYNMTCEDGHVEVFNESTEFVCGKDNPLHNKNDNYDYYDDIDYLQSFNLT